METRVVYRAVSLPTFLMATLLSCGCGSSAGVTASVSQTVVQTVGTFTLIDSGCRFEESAHVKSGSVRVALVNQTADGAHFDFWRLQPGHSYAEFATYVSEEGRRLRSAEPEQGHPQFADLVSSAAVQVRASGALTATLDQASYGMACIRWKLSEGAPSDMYPAGPLVAG